jgi:hypothetical protein
VIKEIASRRADMAKEPLGELSENFKHQWNIKMLGQPSWRLASRAAGIFLAFLAALSISSGLKPNPEDWIMAFIAAGVTAFCAISVFFVQGLPSVADARRTSFTKLQTQVEKTVKDIQAGIHGEMSVLLSSRLSAWEKELRLELIEGVEAALGTAGRHAQQLWADRVEAIQRELAQLNIGRQPAARPSDRQAELAKAKWNAKLRLRETWRGTILEGSTL